MQNPPDDRIRNTVSLRFAGASREAPTDWALSPDQRVRQREAVKRAFRALGPDAARPFLDRYNSGLRGRPLDLAIASAAGLEAVTTALCVESRRGLESS